MTSQILLEVTFLVHKFNLCFHIIANNTASLKQVTHY